MTILSIIIMVLLAIFGVIVIAVKLFDWHAQKAIPMTRMERAHYAFWSVMTFVVVVVLSVSWAHASVNVLCNAVKVQIEQNQ